MRGASGATLSYQTVDGDGEPVAPVGTVTVAVTRSNGDSVTVGSVSQSGTGPASVTLPAAATASVDWLTAVWSDNGVEVATTTTEIVGGVIMSWDYAKTVDATLAAKQTRFPAARKATEDTLTAELGRSPVPRFYTERIPGSGTSNLIVSWPDVTEVVWAKVWTSATTSTDLTAAEIAAIPANDSGILRRTDGKVWSANCDIEVGYRFGMVAIPSDLRDNLLLAIRYHLNKFNNDREFLGQRISFADGSNVSNNRPGVGRSITGNDDVDAAIRRHAFMHIGVA